MYQKSRHGLSCPVCHEAMQGHSISYHDYKCTNCGTGVSVIQIVTNQGIEQVIGAMCLVGLLALFISIVK